MKTLVRSIAFLLIMTIITGLLYTLAVTGIARVCFPAQAAGSIITLDNRQVGCSLLAQPFSDPKYLWGRPMLADTTTFTDEQGVGLFFALPSNQDPSTEQYAQLVAQRSADLRQANPQMGMAPIPIELVTVSGSGLDPDITPTGALYQVPRIAQARGIDPSLVEQAIEEHTTHKFLGIFGQERVNVLAVNLTLDEML